MRRHYLKPASPTPSWLLSRQIGYGLVLLMLLLDNPQAMLQAPGTALLGVVLFGELFSMWARIFIKGWRNEI